MGKCIDRNSQSERARYIINSCDKKRTSLSPLLAANSCISFSIWTDFKTTAVNNTNSTQAPNRTISSGLLTRGQSNGTVTHPYRRMKFRLTKKRIYNDNRTKRKKHPLREKNAVPPKSDATTTTTTYTTSMVKEMGASKRANIPCTREECEKRKNCFNEKWSHECFCDDATCSNKPGVMDARKDKDARMKGKCPQIVLCNSFFKILVYALHKSVKVAWLFISLW